MVNRRVWRAAVLDYLNKFIRGNVDVRIVIHDYPRFLWTAISTNKHGKCQRMSHYIPRNILYRLEAYIRNLGVFRPHLWDKQLWPMNQGFLRLYRKSYYSIPFL